MRLGNPELSFFPEHRPPHRRYRNGGASEIDRNIRRDTSQQTICFRSCQWEDVHQGYDAEYDQKMSRRLSTAP